MPIAISMAAARRKSRQKRVLGEWWDNGAETIRGAWQSKSAASLAASYLDLSGNGSDLFPDASSDGQVRWLRIPGVIAGTQARSIIVRHTAVSEDAPGVVFVWEDPLDVGPFLEDETDGTALLARGVEIRFGGRKRRLTITGSAEGVIAVTCPAYGSERALSVYKDGVLLGIDKADAQAYNMNGEGGRATYGAGRIDISSWHVAAVAALAIYDGELGAAGVGEITEAMTKI